MKLDRSCALIIVDMQNDFMPTGPLPVPDADKIVPVLNKYIEMFVANKLQIFAIRDWHPPNHMSFKQRGGVWPMHCVKDTTGADFHSDLRIPRSATVVSHGTDADKETYSGFESPEFAKKLEHNKIQCVLICGVATDYCVKNTALDAIKLGLDVVLLADAVKGIRNGHDAIKEMQDNGVKVVRLIEITA
jgi:nicotinamidase/pyrazinamidase